MADLLWKSLGVILQDCRARERLSQQDAAQRVGLPRSTISLIETGAFKGSIRLVNIYMDFFDLNNCEAVNASRNEHQEELPVETDNTYAEGLLNRHPAHTVFNKLTSIVTHVLGAPADYSTPTKCRFCQTTCTLPNDKLFSVEDSFGRYYLCEACQSFKVSDIAIMGKERSAGVSGAVPHKFGMLPGAGWIYSFSTGVNVLFLPPGSYKKMPEKFFDLCQAEVVSCAIGGQIAAIANLDIGYPALYIRDFGKKTNKLIESLRFSYSERELMACSQNGTSGPAYNTAAINLTAIKDILNLFGGMDKKAIKKVFTTIYDLSAGRLSPADATKALKDEQAVKRAISLYPQCPHQRRMMTVHLKSMIK